MDEIHEEGDTSMPFVYELGAEGRTFSTRPRGAQLRQRLLDNAGGATAVVLDFSDVLSISYSFADEFVGSMRHSEARGDLPFRFSIVGASQEVARVIGRAEQNRSASFGSVEPPCFA